MSLPQCYSSLLDSMNAEIRIRWLQIVVRNDYYPDLHRVRRFLESQVRRLGVPERAVGTTGYLGWQGARASGFPGRIGAPPPAPPRPLWVPAAGLGKTGRLQRARGGGAGGVPACD